MPKDPGVQHSALDKSRRHIAGSLGCAPRARADATSKVVHRASKDPRTDPTTGQCAYRDKANDSPLHASSH